MATTDQARLELVSQAIDSIISSGTSSYQLADGRNATALDIKTLYDLEDMLKARIARRSAGLFGVVEFRRPR